MMNKQDMLKVQTCVLRVNIHCEGCKDKVKKKLQKVQGVYKVNIDVEQGKVLVSGNVDPAVLIEKLEKSGKHAELVGAQNRQNPANFFNNNPSNGGKDNRSQKGGKDQQKSGHQQIHLQQQKSFKGMKDMKFLGKDNNKSGKFNFSEDEEDDDDFDDEFDDDSDEEFVTGHQVSHKVANGGHLKGKNGAKQGKKGGGFDFLKGMLGKTGAKDGDGKNSGKSKAEKGNQDHQGGGKKGGKNVGFVVGDGKSGAKNGKNDGKNNDGWSKKGGEKFDVVPKMDNKQQGFKEVSANHKGLNGGNIGMMGANYPMGNFPAAAAAAAQGMHMGNFPGLTGNFPGAAQGRPAAADHFGMGHGNPYNNQQQQYMAQMMMMNQQRANGNDMYNPMMFNRPVHPGMNYGPPPPPNDKFTHIFSDENTDSCSIM